VGASNSTHIFGTCVPVEEPSTASQAAVSNRSKPGPYSIEWLDLFRWPRRGSQLPEQHVTMANVFDQFDTPAPNVFNQFDAQTARAAPTLSEMSTEDLLRGYQGTAPAAPLPREAGAMVGELISKFIN
jgi:hypothetical protein